MKPLLCLTLSGLCLVGALRSSGAPAAPEFDWSGPYAGLHAGSVSGNFRFNANTVSALTTVGTAVSALPASIPLAETGRGAGAIGGAQLGENMQLGNWVVGGELDFSFRSIRRAADLTAPLPAPILVDPAAVYVHEEGRSTYDGSSRLRFGYAWGRNLFYGTGGLALSRIQVSSRGTWGLALVPAALRTGALNANPFTHERTNFGWTGGFGFERALSARLGLGIEYRRSATSNTTYHLGAHPSGDSRILPTTLGAKLTDDQVTVRLNFHYGN